MTGPTGKALSPRGAGRLRSLVARLLVLALGMLVLPTAFGVPTASAALLGDAKRTALTPWTACQDVVFLGARGSGQALNDQNLNMGSTVYGAFLTYATQVKGRRIAGYGVVYPSQAVSALITPYYFSGLSDGVDDTLGTLRRRAPKCPKERYVLAGYSQGAMVMHRVMFQLEKSKDAVLVAAARRIDGFLLIGDGDRVLHQGGKRYGTSEDVLLNFGVSWGFPLVDQGKYKPVAAKVPSAYATRFLSVCDRGDLVCDYGAAASGGATTLALGVLVHTQHYGPSSSGITAATKVLAKRAMARPAQPEMRITTSVLPALVLGRPYRAQLSVIRGVPGYRWGARSVLPKGLTLSASGLLSGTPSAGADSLSVQVSDRNGQTVSRVIPFAKPATPALVVGSAVGVWRGSYTCAQGLTGLTLTLRAGASSGALEGSFSFYALPQNPNVPSGEYLMRGTQTGSHVQLSGEQWITRPESYMMVGLTGDVSGGSPATFTGQVPECGRPFNLVKG